MKQDSLSKDSKSINRQLHRFNRQIIVMYIISFILFVVAAGLIVGNQNNIMIMQTDTLNVINDMRVEQDGLESEVPPSDPILVHCLSADERDLVERVVAAESRGEDLQGQMAVANVILDRAELWDMTPAEVVQAPGQFADLYQGEISDSIHLAVANVFDGGVRVFQEPVTHFYSGEEPYWADEKVNRGSIGCHRFLY